MCYKISDFLVFNKVEFYGFDFLWNKKTKKKKQTVVLFKITCYALLEDVRSKKQVKGIDFVLNNNNWKKLNFFWLKEYVAHFLKIYIL